MKRVFIALCLSVGLSACNSGSAPSSSSPGKSVENMVKLLAKGEVQAANKFLNKDMQNRNFAAAAAKAFTQGKFKTISTEEKNIKGDIAEVIFFAEGENGGKAKVRFDMLRENGHWVASSMIPMCSAKKDKELPC